LLRSCCFHATRFHLVEVAFYYWTCRITPDARLEADLNLLFGERLKIEEELLLVHTHLAHRDNDWLTTISELVRSHIARFQVPLLTSRPRFPYGAVPLKGMQMAKASRYIIWAHRDAHSVFGAANNPVVRNGSLLSFNDKERAHAECDRLNAHMGNPHVRYSIRSAPLDQRSQTAA